MIRIHLNMGYIRLYHAISHLKMVTLIGKLMIHYMINYDFMGYIPQRTISKTNSYHGLYFKDHFLMINYD